MKHFYTLLILIGVTPNLTAQIVSIPDANFKAKLLQANSSNAIASTQAINDSGTVDFYTSIDSNGDGEIQLTEAQAIQYLNVSTSQISDLEGINSFSNLTALYCTQNNLQVLNLNASANLKVLVCEDNSISTLDPTIFPNLKFLDCKFNELTALDFSGLTNLKAISCDANHLTSLDVSNLPSLTNLDCSSNLLTSLNTSGSINLTNINCETNLFTALDFSGLPNLDQLDFPGNHQLVYVNVKNGHVEETEFQDCPNLTYICADEADLSYFDWYLNQYQIQNCQVNTYCSFEPGGRFYTINGNSHIDYDNNGCDNNDLNFPNLNLAITDGTASGNIISNTSGQFTVDLVPGDYNITPVLEHPNYFNVSPTNIQVHFPGQSPVLQDFCITPNGTHPDLEVLLIPLAPARPGFDCQYKIVYKNKGNIPLSGTVNFTFDDASVDFVLGSPMPNTQSPGVLNWSYVDLFPYQSREITFTLNLNSPMETPAVNIGDSVRFTAAIYPMSEDEQQDDNVNSLRQIVVGSFDPNDKTCLEGNTITPGMVGDYVHYLIRFENTGTFPAQNIVVRDDIDATKFDISTLVPEHGSHPFVTRITGNKVEFIFENINLPFDDANNDGYVAFKIKTKPTLVEGDTFSNTANIYFDYNFPVTTNTTTTIVQALGISDFDFGSVFSLSPVPAKNVLNITAKQDVEISSVSIYNALGQVVQVNTGSNKTVDVSALKTGTYFIKIISDKGTASSKFIKE